MRIAAILCFLALSSCSSPIDSKQTCEACEAFFVEYNRLKSIKSDNLSREKLERILLSAENLSTISTNKFCLINTPEKELLDFFRDHIFEKNDSEILIMHYSHSDRFDFIRFYIKELNGKRVNVGNQVDSFLLEQCIAMDKRKGNSQ